MADAEKAQYTGDSKLDGKNVVKVSSDEATSVEELNASGHVDKLKRHYGLLSICATALTVDSAWIAL